jgi:hypothetical protein
MLEVVLAEMEPIGSGRVLAGKALAEKLPALVVAPASIVPEPLEAVSLVALPSVGQKMVVRGR